MHAVMVGNKQTVQLLVEHGANMAARSKIGTTARDIAAARSHDEILNFLDEEATLRIRKYYQRRLRAFLLGTHEHIGRRSIVRFLPSDIVGIIAESATAVYEDQLEKFYVS
eukprot:c15124_g1_i4.p2 GENE.c15124_g1_i4~~c15124_g1_i4.p2  ORF type:complete len:111 (+),score=14.22 c15124_g1_i4:314-646(+)